MQTVKYKKVKVKLEKEGYKFKIERGVRQCDLISPKLFTAVLEEVFSIVYKKCLMN